MKYTNSVQQTRSIDLPADSNFAVAMRNQQEAERAEQQRIKRLVLNYDLRNDDDEYANANGEFNHSQYILQPNLNRHNRKTATELQITKIGSTPSQSSHERATSIYPRDFANAVAGEKIASQDTANTTSTRQSGNQSGRGGSKRQQQTRKLQLSDVDWYVL